MSLSHRLGSERRPAPQPDDAPLSPPATRGRRSRWGDPRLWIGVLLVLVSLLVGARVFAAADDTVSIWTMRHAAVKGAPVRAADVQLTQVHFGDAANAGRYVSAAAPLGAGARLTRDVGAGELLAVSALTTDAAPPPQQLPLGVSPSGLPPGLSPGDRVDVWAVPSSDSKAGQLPVHVLRDVTVSAIGGAGLGGLGGDRQVLVAVTAGTDIGDVLKALDGSAVVLIQDGS